MTFAAGAYIEDITSVRDCWILVKINTGFSVISIPTSVIGFAFYCKEISWNTGHRFLQLSLAMCGGSCHFMGCDGLTDCLVYMKVKQMKSTTFSSTIFYITALHL
jgi:hypothetical protein